MKRLLVVGLTTAALATTPFLATAATAGATQRSASLASDTDGTYVSVTPARLLDTRSTGKIAAGGTKSVQITGRAGIPTSGVSAVVANLTVTGGTRSGYLSAYPGTTFPGTSSLNFAAGETRANLVTVPVADDGTLTVLNGGGTGTAAANVLVDVEGYYLEDTPTTTKTAASTSTAPAQFFPEDPYRLGDTREEGGRLVAGDDYYTGLYYFDGFPDGVAGTDEPSDPSNIVAVAVNVTAVNPSGSGFLQAYDGESEIPSTSILNFAKGRTTPNNAIVPTSVFTEDEDGDTFTTVQFAIHNGSSSGSTDLLVDLVGTYSTGGGGLVFRPLDAPVRMVDTRSGKGASKFTGAQVKTVQATPEVLNPTQSSLTSALVGNLTAIRPTTTTYLTVWPQRQRPEVSNLNPAKGQTVANHSYVGLTTAGKFNVYNAGGTTDVLLDVTGRFDQAALTADARRTAASPSTSPTTRLVKVVHTRHRHAR